ncbi:DUF2057 domain-containing protein [Pseudoalteromonas luteoviolacea]|uniref:DUF2057 domain-containing protein n=1 Tax=Pseudoalteromonas luteoviolacea TaxID=43657 RepID=UPI001B36596F|nr:DUF2057 domain-containing protein [Pseudoalteromonas luteoviolacea]MBQ4813864.1 DUF2057 domain-containing protein [Pseudoalteromonas luteoviolacea]
MKKISIFGVLVALFSGISVSGEVNFPEELLPLQVNDTEIEHSFFNKVRTLDLPAGVHRIKVKYSDLFELDYDEHEVVDSAPFWVEVELRDGDYQVRFEAIEDVEQARRFAKSPSIWLQAKQGEKVSAKRVTQQLSKPAAPIKVAVAHHPEVSMPSLSEAPTAGRPDAAAMLMFWWQQASPEQRAAFLATIKKDNK